jgi:hypothetical protein
MLRHILIITSSGLVVFEKIFVGGIEQPRLVGSLLTALMEFARQYAGLRVKYLELSNGMLLCCYLLVNSFHSRIQFEK